MAVRLRLARHGAKKTPFYRIVAADGRAPRDGRFLEVVGTYDPMQDPANVRLKQERIEYWMSVGATPTDTVRSLLRRARRTPETVTFLDGTAAAEAQIPAKAKPAPKAVAKAEAKAEPPAAAVEVAAAPVAAVEEAVVEEAVAEAVEAPAEEPEAAEATPEGDAE